MVRPTQEERKAETRERLVAAAADLFAARGVDGVSIDTIAEAAGRTSGAVYAHFGGKDGLVLAVLDRWAGAAARAIGASSEADRMRSTWTNFTTSDDAVRLLHELWLRAARDDGVRGALADRIAESRAAMAAVYAGWGVADPEAAAVVVFALLLGLDMQRRLDPSAVSDDDAVAAMQTVFTKEQSHAHAHL